MKKVFIKDIKEKDQINDTFLVTRKDTGISRSGKSYLNLKIADTTGELEARVWDDAEALGRKFQKDDVVSIKGFAVAYLGSIQVNITEINRVPDDSYSIREYLPASKRNIDEMAVELEGIISGMKDAHLKRLLTSIFGDPDIRERFIIAPAAKSMHHPYLGGLIEHVLSICSLAELVAGHYGENVFKDLLTAGAILHDIGKIYELSYKRAFDYTDEGRLLGHITMGVELIDNHLAGIKDFPKELATLLKHMILSHHGHLEFGSPKRPKTLEAMILYYLDDLDAKVAAINALAAADREGGGWTSFQRLFDRAIYKGGALQPAEEPPAENEGKKDAGKVELELFKKIF